MISITRSSYYVTVFHDFHILLVYLYPGTHVWY